MSEFILFAGNTLIGLFGNVFSPFSKLHSKYYKIIFRLTLEGYWIRNEKIQLPKIIATTRINYHHVSAVTKANNRESHEYSLLQETLALRAAPTYLITA